MKEQLDSGAELKEGAMRWASCYMSVSLGVVKPAVRAAATGAAAGSEQ